MVILDDNLSLYQIALFLKQCVLWLAHGVIFTDFGEESTTDIAFTNVIVQSYINNFGEMAMAGYGTYSKIEGFTFLPINIFTLAMTTFVGQNIGAGQVEQTKRGARFGILATVVLGEIVGVIVFLLASQLIASFDATLEVIRFGAALFYFLFAYSHSVAFILRGAGKAVVPMIIMMTCWCTIRVAFLVVIIPLTHAIQMVNVVYPLTWGLSSIVFSVTISAQIG